MKTLEEEEERNANDESEGSRVPTIKISQCKPRSHTDCGPKHEEGRRRSSFLSVPCDEPEPVEMRQPSFSQKSPDSEFVSEVKGKDYGRHSNRRSSTCDEGGWTYPSGSRKPSDAKSEKLHGKDGEKRQQPVLGKIFQAFRQPSIPTLDMLGNLGKASYSRRDSHATTVGSSRRHSQLDGMPEGSNRGFVRRHSQMDAVQEGTSRMFSRRYSQESTTRPEISLLLHKQQSPRHVANQTGRNNQNRLIIRRPSGAITFVPDQMNVHQKRYIMGLLQRSNNSLPELCRDARNNSEEKKMKRKPCSDGNDAYISAMSALYANLLCVLGIAFPVTEVLSPHVPAHFYQAYHLYLYMGSLAYMSFMYCTLLKDRAVFKIIQTSLNVEEGEVERIRDRRNSMLVLTPGRYGSFYLRLGAVAFGIGSMVYSGLEFGEYFELKQDRTCHNIIQAVTPVSRMILTLVQMQFIFLSSRKMEMSKYRGITKFGLMHMVATNLCEWLNVIVEETKHEIIHLAHLDDASSKEEGDKHDSAERHDSDVHDIYECRRTKVMGSLAQDTSPFLFPCTIEYSLICAVILYELWKDIKKVPADGLEENEERLSVHRHSSVESELQKSNHFLSVDCSNAHKGLFSGILVLVMTIISLIMFFVMTKDPIYYHLAVYEVNVCELIVYCITTLMVVAGGWKMRYFKYKLGNRIREGIGLDNILLMWAQTGTYIYCMFSIIACYFMIDHGAPGGFITEMCALIQTTCQTAFILDATFRTTNSLEQHKNKPGRQIVTFLLVANMTLWLLNTLQKNKAEFRPTHLEFYGVWAWTIITHVSMPLAIFYRFHSTICLFEIWKDVYKFKQDQHQV